MVVVVTVEVAALGSDVVATLDDDLLTCGLLTVFFPLFVPSPQLLTGCSALNGSTCASLPAELSCRLHSVTRDENLLLSARFFTS